MDRVGIILHTCDKKPYCDVWNSWHKQFIEHWDNNIECDFYFVNEEKDFLLPNFKQIKTGKGQWSDRLRLALDKIPNEIVIYLQEDFFFKKNYTKEDHHKYLRLFREYKMNCLRLSNMSKMYMVKKTDGGLYKVLDESDYIISHQMSFWNRDFMKTILFPNQTPWQNETDGSERIKNNKNEVFMIGNQYYDAIIRKGVILDHYRHYIK